MTVAASVVAMATSANALEYTPYVGVDYIHSIANTERLGNAKPDYDGASFNVGTKFNQNFGTEIFYQKTDKDNKQTGAEKIETSYEAYGLDLMGYLPLGCDGDVALLGTVGLGVYNFDRHVDNQRGTLHDEGIGYRAGVGAMYNFNESWAVRGIVRYVGLDKVDDSINADHMMEYSMGVRYSF